MLLKIALIRDLLIPNRTLWVLLKLTSQEDYEKDWIPYRIPCIMTKMVERP